jgi:hypothetical protein
MTVKKPSGFVSSDDLDRDIAQFESMSEEEIDKQLALYGVDAEETVQAVLDLVHAKLEEWRHRGLLHAKAILMFCAAVVGFGVARLISSARHLGSRSGLVHFRK